ncbi:hypothetical protein HK101_007673 [Irineochytrium annulatum]|nr:hypothetical protein HK101_007673 [Irineochytrium annulatum]
MLASSLLFILASLAPAALAAPAPGGSSGGGDGGGGGGTPPPPATCPSFKKVMYIIFENENQADVMSDSYFGTTLPSKGYLLTNMLAEAHPSQPNYIAMVSGSTHGVTGDSNVNLNYQSIADLLEAKGLTWKSYQENYSGTCNTAATIGGSGAYARKHNPFISFTNIQSNSTRCARIVPATQLATDASSAAGLPNYIYYTPNLKNDGHDTDIPTASAWLKAFLEPKLVDPAYADVLFFITFDESASYLGANHIYTVLLGKGIKGKGMTDGAQYNHYSMMATIEYNFALGNLGNSDKTATLIPIAAGPATC